MKSYTKVTEKDFELIKALQKAGYPPKKIVELTGRSTGTCWNIQQVETFKDYQDFVGQSKKKQEVTENDPRLEALERLVETCDFMLNQIKALRSLL